MRDGNMAMPMFSAALAQPYVMSHMGYILQLLLGVLHEDDVFQPKPPK